MIDWSLTFLSLPGLLLWGWHSSFGALKQRTMFLTLQTDYFIVQRFLQLYMQAKESYRATK